MSLGFSPPKSKPPRKSYAKEVFIGCFTIFLLVVLSGGGYMFGCYRHTVMLNEEVKENWELLESNLQTREKNVHLMIGYFKGISENEKDVYTQIGAARVANKDAKTVAEKIAAAKAMDYALHNVILLRDKFPQVEQDQRFLDLLQQFKEYEQSMESSRKLYNLSLTELEEYSKQPVGALFANFIRASKIEYYRVERVTIPKRHDG